MRSRAVFGLLVALLLGAHERAAAADKCRAQEAKFQSVIAPMNRLAERATAVAMACAFRGPDDKALAKLAQVAVTAYRKLKSTDPEATADCTRRNPQVVLEAVSQWMGSQLGFAYGSCSSEADRIGKAVTSDDERRAQVAPLVTRYMTDIMERAGISMPPAR